MSETNETDLNRKMEGHVVFPDNTVKNPTPGSTYYDYEKAKVILVESTTSDGAKHMAIHIDIVSLEKSENLFKKLAQFTFIPEDQSSEEPE
jgi:hypothetical protein